MMSKRPSPEWDNSQLIKDLAEAGTKGLTQAEIKKKIPKTLQRKIVTFIGDLKQNGSLNGPFTIGRRKSYFDRAHAPKREQMERHLEELIRQQGMRLISRSSLAEKVRNFPKEFFQDALSLLRSEYRILELQGSTKSVLYIHREPVLEQLGLTGITEQSSITLEMLGPVYRTLRAQQGGISAVTIYDLLKKLNATKNEVHDLLLREAKLGRVSLHPASTVNFPREVIDAGIRVEGQPQPFITVVLREGT
jgi:hypothetical protein